MRFRSFGSGSSGNAYIFEAKGGTFLIDSGIGVRKLAKYAIQYGHSLNSLHCLLLTHDHVDHAKSAGMVSRKYNIPVYATEKTFRGVDENPVIGKKPLSEHRNVIESGKKYNICGCGITPIQVCHDSKDCVGYFIEEEENNLCLLTDVGQITPEIEHYLKITQNIIIEANYDDKMLAEGPYPKFLQDRIKGGYGHLSNKQTGEIILRHYTHLKKIWLCHLSENNNTPEQALTIINDILRGDNVIAENTPPIIPLSRLVPSALYEF